MLPVNALSDFGPCPNNNTVNSYKSRIIQFLRNKNIESIALYKITISEEQAKNIPNAIR